MLQTLDLRPLQSPAWQAAPYRLLALLTQLGDVCDGCLALLGLVLASPSLHLLAEALGLTLLAPAAGTATQGWGSTNRGTLLV